MSNPLLENYDLAPFRSIKPEHIKPAIEQSLNEFKQAIIALLEDQKDPTWESLMQPLEQFGNTLDKRWSPVSHMNSVVNSDELRKAYDECLPLLSEYSTWIGQNQELFQAVKKLDEKKAQLNLDEVQIKILKDELRDFKLAGVSLPDDKKKRYGEIQKRLSELSSKYEQNILDATMSWSKHFADENALAGLPESALGLAKQNAQADDKSGFLINLEFPCYYAVMTYANDQNLREEVYRAYSTRASELSDEGKFNNAPLMDEILSLRHELALLLGFNHFGELSLASKMAESTDQVLEFLLDLAKKSKPQAEKELVELSDFAKENLSLDSLNAWDVLYAGEKLKEHRYAVSQEQLRPYFPVNKVLEGLFKITETLFSVTIKETQQDFDKWHESARLFEVYDANEDLTARFYIDLFARANKRGGAWMADYCSRFRFDDGHLQKPVAFLTCNFNPPIENKPALLTHDEVVTLFHEFGHGLHHMLTKVEYLSASGIHGVEWDAVELPSQFMENFCYEDEGLNKISGHYETGEPLPSELREKLQRAKNFQSAMFMVRQLEFSLFDFRIHAEYSTDSNVDIQKTLNDVRQEVAVVIPPDWNRFQNSFSHIFAGGYSAGYYSYKWAEVLSADAFSKFEEEGIFDPATGLAFKENILEKGGSEPAMNLFKKFRGREPDVEPLLRHSGIQA
ncbi:oligopeptidase A [Pleionea sediminis]|uniref:oligopeptidase A n=1 Tax=Pleionea sediminis TaxID=2569479 RepID=UPI00118653D8|nr:oligopeptidase A [Pleionea sediminis]